jgi:transposase-like protein
MLKDSDTPRYAVRRTKRTYSAETKSELLAACNAPGASIAAVASANGMNANVLHRWLKDSSLSRQPIGTVATAVDIAVQGEPSFIAVPLLAKRKRPAKSPC